MTSPAWRADAPSVAVERQAPELVRVLRLRRPSGGALSRIAEVTGLVPPEPGKVAGDGAARLLWIGLWEWLVVGDLALDASLAVICDEVAASHVVDVTDALVAYEVSGADAADLLAKGCTLDFHRTAFPEAGCAQTAFAQVAVVVERFARTGFRLYVDRSYSRHFDAWFEDAVIEFRAERIPH